MQPKVGDSAILCTSHWWFAGETLHEVKILRIFGSHYLVRGTKKRFGCLWRVHKDFWVADYDLRLGGEY